MPTGSWEQGAVLLGAAVPRAAAIDTSSEARSVLPAVGLASGFPDKSQWMRSRPYKP